MEAQSFLIVDEEPVFLGLALQYLHFAGKLEGFVYEILRQHTLRKELEHQTDLEVKPVQIEQAIHNFRLQTQLTQSENFQRWLKNNSLDYFTFQQRIELGLKLEQFKEKLTQAKLNSYFIERKLSLDQFVLSRIVTDSQELAEELKIQLHEGSSFEQLAREYSISEDKIFNGMMGLVSRGDMSDALRSLLEVATPGSLIGPIRIEQYWCIYRIEQFLPASLENASLQKLLKDEIWEQWLADKIRRLKVNLQVYS